MIKHLKIIRRNDNQIVPNFWPVSAEHQSVFVPDESFIYDPLKRLIQKLCNVRIRGLQ